MNPFDRKQHGSLYDRGMADSYYRRPADPHYWRAGRKVEVTDAESVAEYTAGYQQNQKQRSFRDYEDEK